MIRVQSEQLGPGDRRFEKVVHAKPSISLDVYRLLIPRIQSEITELMHEITIPIELPVAPQVHQEFKLDISEQ